MAISFSTIGQDVRYALRQLRKSPGFALTAILTIALGIGATTAIFTLTYQVLLRSLPVDHPEQLYKIGKDTECCVTGGLQDDWSLFSYDLYRSLRAGTPHVSDMAAIDSGAISVGARMAGDAGSAEPLRVRTVSSNYFSFLGVHAMQGRLFRPEDDHEGAAPVAVVSHALWASKFHGDPGLVGKTVLLTGTPVTVVGITPASFLGERNTGDPAGFWMPLAQEPLLDTTRKLMHYPTAHWLDILVRIPDAGDVPTVEKSIQTQLVQWIRLNRGPGENTTPAQIARQTTELAPANGGINDLRTQYETSLKLLLLVTGAVLLICCANLANLLLVRAVARRQELSVRTALGASRAVLIRQMLVEALVIAVLGGAGAIAVAFGGARAMLALAMKGITVSPLSASPSMPVLLFALALSVLTGVLFGIAPAVITSRANPAEALRGANRSTGQTASLPQRVLVILQAALSVALLSVAGLLIGSLRNLEHQDFRFEPEGRLIAFTNLQGAGYRYDQLASLYRRFDQAFAAQPDIASMAYATYGPMADNNWGSGVAFPGREAGGQASYAAVSSHFFETIGTRVLMGRGITDEDTATSAHVAVVNRTFVDKYLAGKPPIGEHFGPDRSMTGEYQIVGVVDDSKYGDPTQPTRAMFFTPITQFTSYAGINATSSQKEQAETGEQYRHYSTNLIVRYRGDAAAAANTVRNTLHGIDPAIPIAKLLTYPEQVGGYFTQQELVVRLTSIFGILALVLASVGLYGVTAYGVARRVPEIGLRMALGSDRGSILRLVLRGAMTQTGIGLALGIPGALLAGHFLRSELFGVTGHDVSTVAAASAVLAVAALIAGYLPARRASSVEPVVALRSE